MKRPIILIHGLWNSSKLFRRLIDNFDDDKIQFFAPSLPHLLGRRSISCLAEDLNTYIIDRLGTDQKVNIVGFSMGGIIARIWLQQWNGAFRTNNFLTIGSPHNGTFTAQFIPSLLFPGIAEMKRGSELLSELNRDTSHLNGINCSSFYCQWDLMSFPGWQSVLPLGECYSIPVWTHKELITSPISLGILTNKIISDFD